MKIKIGIVGYGNLGKACEKLVLSNKNLSLIAIFSRRQVISPFKTLIEPYENHVHFKNKIDVMLLCGSSMFDIEDQLKEIAPLFSSINAFDTHLKIANVLKDADDLSKKHKTIQIIACGWDPGLFSIFRSYICAISKEVPDTFWGKGISMGHSDVTRQVSGVEDAVEFTIPNQNAIKESSKIGHHQQTNKHYRECFVVAKNNQSLIEKTIKNIPNYFKGEVTRVHFVSKEKLLKLKEKMSHKGLIIKNGKFIDGSSFKFKIAVSMESNPTFTANIMILYINAIVKLKEENKFGAYTCLEIPPSYLFGSDKFVINSKLC